MNKRWYFFIFVLIAVLLEATFLNYFRIFNTRPGLILCLIVLASLCLDTRDALILAIFAGILKDAFSVQAFGIDIFLFPLWSFLIIKLSRKISLDNDYLRLVLVLAVVIIHDITARSVFLSLGRTVVPPGIFLRVTFLESIYTALAFALVSKAIKPIIPE